MTQDELREKLENWFIDMASGRHQYPIEGIPSAEEIAGWRANQLMALIKETLPELAKEAGYVKLAEDQTLPKWGVANYMLLGDEGRRAADYKAEQIREVQKDMLKAGWRKVELEK